MHLFVYGKLVNRTVWVIMMAAMLIIFLHDRKSERPECGGSNCVIERSVRDECINSCVGMHSERKMLVIWGFMALYAGIFIAVNPVNYLRVIRCASVVAAMLTIAALDGGGRKIMDMLRSFRDIVMITAGISMVLWLSVTVTGILPFTGYALTDWSPLGECIRVPAFIGIYFEMQPTDWAVVSARNSGLFTEGPMAGFCYCAALIAELFLCGYSERKKHLAAVLLLLVCILSALSVVSCIAALAAVSASLFIRLVREHRSLNRIAAAIAVLVIGVLAVVAVRLALIKLTQGSGSIRLNDFEVGFHAWLAHPLFGGGFENLDYLRSFMPEWRMGLNTGYSNSPVEILAEGGIYIASAYLCAFICASRRAVKCVMRGNFGRLAATVCFAFLFTFTEVSYQYIVYFILIALSLDTSQEKTDMYDI